MLRKIQMVFARVKQLAQERGAVLAAAPIGAGIADAAAPGYNAVPYEIAASTMQSLTINVNTDQLFSGAQLMIDALSNPYLFIAGLSLGVAILGAILAAVRGLRLG